MKKTLSLLLVLVLTLGLGLASANETITIGATVPHSNILELVREDFSNLGYDMNIVEVTEYPIPNPATSIGDMDANYFQHLPYLNAYNSTVDEKDQLSAVIPVHYEPYGIYGGAKTSLEDLKEGDKIAVTNDPSNETRALLLLQEAGYITLPEGTNPESGLTALDIVENPYNLEIIEMNAELLVPALVDVDYAVINGNFAIQGGLKPGDDALKLEDPEGDAGKLYTNYVVVHPDNSEAKWLKALATCLQSEKVKNYMLTNEAFAKGVIPVF